MGRIEIEILINAPIERCFDLSRSIDLHMKSAGETKERAVDGRTSGLIELGETVTWEAIHFGVKQRLTAQITKFQRPNHFQDCQVKGVFKSFVHDHYFESVPGGTLMRDIFEFEAPFGFFGLLVEPIVKRHMEKFLLERNLVIKDVAESNDFALFLQT